MVVEYDGQKLDLLETKYHNGNKAVVLNDSEGYLFCTLSVNLESMPNQDCFWLKDWSENEEIAEYMVSKKIVKLTGRTKATGYVIAKEAILYVKDIDNEQVD
jgi:hypothetical protein